MRKLKCHQVRGMYVQEILDEWNERAEELGLVSESDILSVSTSPPTLTTKVMTPKGDKEPVVEVTIVYWADE